MGFRPIAGMLFYVVSVTGIAMLATELGISVVRQAAFDLALDGSPAPKSSRVDRGLEAQARTAAWQPMHNVVATRAVNPPDISVVELARSIDAAESKPSQSTVAATDPVISKARVAGWVKRSGRASEDAVADADSPARIIERSLKAEM